MSDSHLKYTPVAEIHHDPAQDKVMNEEGSPRPSVALNIHKGK